MKTDPRRPRPKISFSGRVTGVQPRIRLTRSYDEREHTYQGYVLRIGGSVGDEPRDFVIAIGESPQARNAFRLGDLVKGEGEPVPDPNLETAELYRVAKLKLVERKGEEKTGRRGRAWRRGFRSTASAVTGGSTRALTRESARAASGAAGWQSR